jgi:Tol biopolymer transport system component
LALVLGGCGQPVKENRTINWSPDGKTVSFQHGADGVFIAGQDGKGLRKIFQPGPDILATSLPLWSPTERRLIFTTARPTDADSVPNRPAAAEPDPAGRIYRERPIVYTCWLWTESKQDPLPQPVALFEATSDHTGYVAANLAVRWHPAGDRILYINQAAGTKEHGLFAYDLKAKTSRRVFAHTSEALIFDWAPDQAHVVCVLGTLTGNRDRDGIWIGQPEQEAWWHVPRSEALAQGQRASLLERLRATRPVWTADGARFAFVSYQPAPDGQGGRHSLYLGTFARRQVETLAVGPDPFGDLHWAPGGDRLGVVRKGTEPSLHLARRGEGLSAPINRRPVRQFAGWDPTGTKLAYVVAEDDPAGRGDAWAFLLTPEPQARDAVFVADGSGKEPGRAVFSGMRVTFPQWSPRDGKLSVWFTFTPTHRSSLSSFCESLSAGRWAWGLRPGDPAAVFDPKSGQVSWLAVNAHEKAQVGHYYLLRRDYARAWQWYTEAEREWPAVQPGSGEPGGDNVAAAREMAFFQSYCLSKLGKPAEAQAKLKTFRSAFRPDLPTAPALGQEGKETRRRARVTEPPFPDLPRDLCLAEVFLSLDAAADGRQFFRRALTAADTDAARLSNAVVLSQLLLLDHKADEYAALVTDTVLPLLVKLWQPAAGAAPTDIDLRVFLIWELLPLYAPEFLARLSEPRVREITPRWRALHDQAKDDEARLLIDLFLEAAERRLGHEGQRQDVARRIEQNPARAKLLPGDGVAGLLKQARDFPALLRTLHQLAE